MVIAHFPNYRADGLHRLENGSTRKRRFGSPVVPFVRYATSMKTTAHFFISSDWPSIEQPSMGLRIAWDTAITPCGLQVKAA